MFCSRFDFNSIHSLLYVFTQSLHKNAAVLSAAKQLQHYSSSSSSSFIFPISRNGHNSFFTSSWLCLITTSTMLAHHRHFAFCQTHCSFLSTPCHALSCYFVCFNSTVTRMDKEQRHCYPTTRNKLNTLIAANSTPTQQMKAGTSAPSEGRAPSHAY